MKYKIYISPEDRASNVYASSALWNGHTTNEKEQMGRCADYILRNMNPVDCFIYGSLEERISRKMSMVPEGLDFTREEIMKRVIDVDKKRAKYYEFYADRKWGRMEDYDLCINTDKVGIDGAVETILAYLEHCR